MADTAIDFASLEAGELDGASGEEQQLDGGASGEEQQGGTGGRGDSGAGGEDGGAAAEHLTGKAIRDAVRAATEQFPEQAKLFQQLADTHFRVEKAYKQAFPTPQEAISARDLLEGIGGVEGAARMQERISAYDAQDDALRVGSPEVLDSFFKDFPEGAANLAPHYLEKLAQANPQAFDAAVAPYAIGMLQSVNLGGYLEAIAAETDPARAKALAKQIADWFSSQSQNVQQMRSQRSTADPRANRLSEREQQLNQREEEIFISSANSMAVPKIESDITKEVEKIARQYKLGDAQKQKFGRLLNQELAERFDNDKTYLQQVALRRSTSRNDPAKVSNYIVTEYRRAMPQTALDLAKGLYGAPRAGAAQVQTGVPKAGQPTTSPAGGPILVSSRPPDSELDLNRPGAAMDLVRGRAYTKSGRYIAWRRNV